MVPATAILVVSDDDRRVVPNRAAPNGFDDVGHVLLTPSQTRVSGVLVVFANGLHERDGWKLA